LDILEVIAKRRSIRKYDPDPIPDEVLGRLLEALRLAPTGGNRQAFRFVVVREQGMKERVAAACRWVPGMPNGHAFVAEAPVVIVACGSEKDSITRFNKDGNVTLGMGVPLADISMDPAAYNNLMAVDLAIALDHLSLAATEAGLGTCWIAALDEREMREVLGVPEDMRALFVMPVGRTSNWPEPRPRKALEDIVSWEKYA
jgi:nitroreductase